MSTGGGEAERTSSSSSKSWGDESAIQRWVLLDGNRWVVVLGLSALLFATLVGLGMAGIIGVTEKSLVAPLLGASITGVFTLVTITTSINQLVLSRILGSPEDIADRIDSVSEFRGHAEGMNPRFAVSPSQPAPFLREIAQVVEDRTARLADAFDDVSDREQAESVDELTAGVMSLTQETDDKLADDDLPLYGTLSPIINDAYSTHLHTLRRIRANLPGLDEDRRDALDELEESLLAINRTRHYFKTLYLHEALADVSRYMLLTGASSLAISYVTLLMYDSSPALGGDQLVVAVSAALVFIHLPFSILVSYLLRASTIAKRTTTFGAFTPVEEMP
jgi:hypothetical protein